MLSLAWKTWLSYHAITAAQCCSVMSLALPSVLRHRAWKSRPTCLSTMHSCYSCTLFLLHNNTAIYKDKNVYYSSLNTQPTFMYKLKWQILVPMKLCLGAAELRSYDLINQRTTEKVEHCHSHTHAHKESWNYYFPCRSIAESYLLGGKYRARQSAKRQHEVNFFIFFSNCRLKVYNWTSWFDFYYETHK